MGEADTRIRCPNCFGRGERRCRCAGDECWCGAETRVCSYCNGSGMVDDPEIEVSGDDGATFGGSKYTGGDGDGGV